MFNTMRRTARQSSTTTLTDLFRALDGRYAVTITYVRADGEESVRTIEIHDIRTTKAGRIIVRAMDRLRDDMRTFHPEQITAYTVHRSRHVMAPPADEAPLAHLARTPDELIALELERDYPAPTAVALAA